MKVLEEKGSFLVWVCLFIYFSIPLLPLLGEVYYAKKRISTEVA